jgi:hypothetical protein
MSREGSKPALQVRTHVVRERLSKLGNATATRATIEIFPRRPANPGGRKDSNRCFFVAIGVVQVRYLVQCTTSAYELKIQENSPCTALYALVRSVDWKDSFYTL